MARSDELETLRQENDDLIARLGEREAELRALRDPLRNAWPRHFGQRPTAEQMSALLRAVQISFPFFKTKDDKTQEIMEQNFRAAFIALSWLPRQTENKLSTSIDNTTWYGRAQDKLTELNIYPNDIHSGPFMAAVLAHGDITHSFDPGRWPYDLSFGLGNHVGRYPDGSGWRRVLDYRTFLPATPLPLSKQPPRPDPRIPQIRFYGGQRDYFGGGL